MSCQDLIPILWGLTNPIPSPYTSPMNELVPKTITQLPLLSPPLVNYHELARRSGLSASTVRKVLRGLTGVNLVIAARIAEAAGVSLDTLYLHFKSVGGVGRYRQRGGHQ